jgi:hypothetical protein
VLLVEEEQWNREREDERAERLATQHPSDAHGRGL